MVSRRALIHRSNRPNRVLPFAVVALVVLGALTACSDSGDDSDATPASDADGTSADGGAVTEPTDDTGTHEDDAPTSGDGSGTLTMGDGTTLTFVMSTCDTSENGADGLPVEDTYDLFGTTADGAFQMQFIRAGLDDDFVVETATLEGDFDEEGKNAGVLYSRVVDTLALTVDGGDVSGTVSLSPIGPNRPYGDMIDATVAVSC